MKILNYVLFLAGLAFVLVYLLPLGVRPLFIPDEVRYAEIAREMISKGDWVVPHLNGLDYFEKPILGHWVHAISQLLFGETRFAVRFPSVLSSGLMALLLVWFGNIPSRLNKQKTLGPLTALIFLSTLAVAGIGTFAVLDSLLALFLTLTLVAFFQATESEKSSRQEVLWLVIAGFSCGLAFLTKGFLALAIPILVAAPYLLWQKRWRDLLRMAWLPLLVAFLVALPWSLWIHQRAPDFWNYFFWHEHVKRFFSEHAQHSRPAWFFVALLPLMAIPWSFQLGSLWQGARLRVEYRSKEQAILRFALCWLIFPLLFFSVSRGKLLTYILPCFPAIAVLISFWLDRYLSSGKQKSFNVGALLAAGFFSLILIALPVVQIVGIKGSAPYSTVLPWLGGSVALLLTIGLFVLSYRNTHGWQKLILFALAPLPFLAFSPNLMPDLTLAKKAPSAFFAEAYKQIEPGGYVISAGNVVRAANWGLKRDDIYLLSGSGELTYGLSQPDGAGRLLDFAEVSQFIALHPGKVLLFAKQKDFKKWGDKLPQPQNQRENHPLGMVALKF